MFLYVLINDKIYLVDIESPPQIRSNNEDDPDEPISAMQKLFPGQAEVFGINRKSCVV